MALQPFTKTGKEILQPGARGERFKADLPGFRGGEERINRTNMKLSTSEHDVPNIKWEFDRRLPVLFRYGYATGYNQIVIPKGRIVAIDPYMNQLDFDTHKALNVLTLANGGTTVKVKTTGDNANKEWEPVDAGYVTTAGGEQVLVVKSVSPTETLAVEAGTGRMTVDGTATNAYRPANRPIGIIQRNEYTRDDNAYNGMQPGAVLTDCMVELPLFALKDKAEANPWGSIYGNVLPGDLLKSDENGRFVVSPLSRTEVLETLTLAQVELERQQIIGQVYSVQRDLLPAGAARYAQWALEDRMNFEQFNPYMWRVNNRNGEDLNEHSPYAPKGGGAISSETNMTGVDPFNPPGYPYDNTMTYHDLHMLASSLRKNDNRFGLEHQLDNGIPGLTDGYNAYVKQYDAESIGAIRRIADDNYGSVFAKMSQTGIEKGSVEVAITNKTKAQLTDDDFKAVTTEGQTLIPAGCTSESITVTYLDETQGFIVFAIDGATFNAETTLAAGEQLSIFVRFKKRGLSGIPTFMDWDGCVGFASVLLQR